MKSPLHLFLPPTLCHLFTLPRPRKEYLTSHAVYAYYNISCTKRTCLLYIWRTFDGSLCTTIYQSREMRKTMSFTLYLSTYTCEWLSFFHIGCSFMTCLTCCCFYVKSGTISCADKGGIFAAGNGLYKCSVVTVPREKMV